MLSTAKPRRGGRDQQKASLTPAVGFREAGALTWLEVRVLGIPFHILTFLLQLL